MVILIAKSFCKARTLITTEQLLLLYRANAKCTYQLEQGSKLDDRFCDDYEVWHMSFKRPTPSSDCAVQLLRMVATKSQATFGRSI